jgi:hypothetical protein
MKETKNIKRYQMRIVRTKNIAGGSTTVTRTPPAETLIS